jgi:putative sugar O-methyltransferase
VHDDPELLKLMLRDAEDQEGIYRPGPYWRAYTQRIARAIAGEGLARFRSSPGIGRGYCDVFAADPLLDLTGWRRHAYVAARALGLHRPYDRMRTASDRRRHAQKDRHFRTELGGWMREFQARCDLPDTTVADPQRRVVFAEREIGELYLRDFAWVSDFSRVADFSAVRSVFEIGGGFGSMAHTLLHLFPNIRKYLYLDIPPNLYVGTQYLKHFFGASVIDYRATRERAAIGFSESDEREILAICPWQIERVETELELFWNSSSFQEMTAEIVSSYARQVERLMGESAAVCLYIYAIRESSRRLTAAAIARLVEQNTSFQVREIEVEVAPRILPGTAWLGLREPRHY